MAVGPRCHTTVQRTVRTPQARTTKVSQSPNNPSRRNHADHADPREGRGRGRASESCGARSPHPTHCPGLLLLGCTRRRLLHSPANAEKIKDNKFVEGHFLVSFFIVVVAQRGGGGARKRITHLRSSVSPDMVVLSCQFQVPPQSFSSLLWNQNKPEKILLGGIRAFYFQLKKGYRKF